MSAIGHDEEVLLRRTYRIRHEKAQAGIGHASGLNSNLDNGAHTGAKEANATG